MPNKGEESIKQKSIIKLIKILKKIKNLLLGCHSLTCSNEAMQEIKRINISNKKTGEKNTTQINIGKTIIAVRIRFLCVLSIYFNCSEILPKRRSLF